MTVAEFLYAIALRPKDPVVSGALTFGVYEKPEAAFLLSVFRSFITFFDVGTNLGYYTALAIARLGKQGRIVAFEPDVENFSFLERTVRANNADKVVCIQKAASDQPGDLTLFGSSGNQGDNRLDRNDLCDGSYIVDVSAVDRILQERGLAKVDVLKIDVQGFERHVFRGLKETIRRSDQMIMLMEFWPFALESAGTPALEFLQELEATSLELFELTANGKAKKVGDEEQFIARYPGRKYTSIIAVRGDALPASLVAHA